jgi:hypothetical protein
VSLVGEVTLSGLAWWLQRQWNPVCLIQIQKDSVCPDLQNWKKTKHQCSVVANTADGILGRGSQQAQMASSLHCRLLEPEKTGAEQHSAVVPSGTILPGLDYPDSILAWGHFPSSHSRMVRQLHLFQMLEKHSDLHLCISGCGRILTELGGWGRLHQTWYAASLSAAAPWRWSPASGLSLNPSLNLELCSLGAHQTSDRAGLQFEQHHQLVERPGTGGVLWEVWKWALGMAAAKYLGHSYCL